MDTVVIPLLKILIILNATLVAVSYMVLLERKVIAWAQSRLGPMRVGPYGVLQPIADAVKLMLKEDITPTRADKWVFTAAPLISMIPALIVYAVIPFGDKAHLFGREITLYVADINVGLLYIVSVASVGVYGIILAGYASNSKYPLLASLRASAQLISYEVAVTLTLVSVIVLSGTLSMVGIVNAQYNAHAWYVFLQPVAFVIVLIGGLAETNRAPFDLPEAEQELVGGYHTEYSGIKLLLFLVAEFLHMVTAAFLIVIMFLGGWHLWGVTGSGPVETWTVALVRFAVLSAKIFGVILFFMLVRWSWPRFRFDQLMNLAWKVMLPLGIVNLVAVAAVEEFRPQLVAALGPGIAKAAAIAIPWVVFFLGWIAAGLLTPSGSDNRPILTHGPLDVEHDLVEA